MKKLLIVFLGLLALIVATPYIFSSISNSKIDETILNLNQNSAVVVKETKTDISYLDTKRNFEITITDKSFPKSKYFVNNYSPILKKVVFSIDMSFRNLPITKVMALGKLKEIDLKGFSKKDYETINKFLKDKIVAHLITSDFKNFNIKFDDIVFNEENLDFKLTGIVSDVEVEKHSLDVKTKISNLSIKGEGNHFIITDIFSKSKIEDNMKKYEGHTDIKEFSLKVVKNKYETNKRYIALLLNDVSFKGHSKTKNNLLEGVSSIAVKKASYSDADKLKVTFSDKIFEFSLAKINYPVLEQIIKDLQSKKQTNLDKLIKELFNSGFELGIKEKINNLKVGEMAFGNNSLDLKLDMDKEEIKKAGGIEPIVSNLGMLKFNGIKLELKLELSKEVYNLLKLQVNPMMLNKYIKDGYIIITPENRLKTKLEIKNGKIFANDKEYKFH